MPINYATTEITAIANGNAITADILNGPSVSLATRTVEIQRNSNYDNFIRDYSTNALVKLTPTLEDNIEPSVRLETRVKGDTGEDTGSIRRYFKASLTGAALSVYADAEAGGRYIVSGDILSGFFSDTAGEEVLSNRLVTPGDGVYLKAPLRHIAGADESATTNFPDLVSPQNSTESLGNNYALSVNGNTDSRKITQHDLIKLPMLNEITLINASRDSLLSSLINELNTLSTATADADTGALTLQTGAGDTLTLRLTGVHNTRCEVTHMVDSGSNCILTVVPATGPIFRHTDEANALDHSSLNFEIYSLAVMQDNPTSTPLSAVTGYLINPKQLEEGYAYIPLLRLTETTLEIGDKSFNLVANYDFTAGNIPLNSLNGAPAGAAPITAEAGTYVQDIKLLDIPKPDFRSGIHTFRLPTPTLVASGGSDILYTSVSNSTDIRLKHILDKVQGGSRLTLVSARYVPVHNITSTANNANLLFNVGVNTDANSDNLSFTAPLGAIASSSASYIDYGSTLEIYHQPGSGTTIHDVNVSEITIIAYLGEAGQDMLSGTFSVEIDLLVTD